MKRHPRRRAARVAAMAQRDRDSNRSRAVPRTQMSRNWLIAISVALVVAAAFAPVLDNGFVNWDDEENFLTNSFFRGLGAAQLRWAWSTFWVGVYQPLAWMLFEVQYLWWNLEPRGYHLISVLLHVGNAVL